MKRLFLLVTVAFVMVLAPCALYAQATGACCLPDGSCVDNTEEDECLTGLSGTAWHEGLDCTQVTCGGTGENSLLRGCCTTLMCDLSTIFPLQPLKDIADPPSETNDTGLLNTSNPLCFYKVEQPAGNSVRITKNPTDGDMLDITY